MEKRNHCLSASMSMKKKFIHSSLSFGITYPERIPCQLVLSHEQHYRQAELARCRY